MKPFSEYRKNYIAACFIIAAIYAFVAGIHQPLVFRLADGIIYGIILFSTGFVLRNIFRFAMPMSSLKYRLAFITVLAIGASTLVVGVETVIAYLCIPITFDAFVLTIPVRIFITFLIIFILYLLYEFTENNRKHSDTISEEISSDLSKTVDTEKTETLNRITVRTGQKIRFIPIENILYIKADGDYISIRTAEGSHLKEQTMKEVEKGLPIDDFVRIHRSYIINIHHISRIERYGERQQVVLHNNEKIKISAARYQTLKQIMGI
jgi:hypothetical protein